MWNSELPVFGLFERHFLGYSSGYATCRFTLLRTTKVVSRAGKAVISSCYRIIIGASIAHLVLANASSGQRPSFGAAVVQSKKELLAAVGSRNVTEIIAASDIDDLEEIKLLPGQSLRSDHEKHATLTFRSYVDGLKLTSDNSLTGIDLRVSPTKRAIWNDRSVDSMGTITIHSVETIGRVQIIASDRIRSGRVEVNGLKIRFADARGESERPKEYGVSVLQGAFTLWNRQFDENVAISADLIGLSAGEFGSPVLGGGIFVGGAGDKGGSLNVQRLETDAIYSDGRLAPGTTDQITGGVFVVYGAHVDCVTNRGPVMTYGPNDMALDNWGVVDRWVGQAKVTTLGMSGIGFVNFGIIRDLRLEAPIETFGQGARGFNVYNGRVDRAEFDQITTHADGAVGIQISQPIGTLLVMRGIQTFGGVGKSLVKGVMQDLAATALSIKSGGSVQLIQIEGGLETRSAASAPLELQGTVGSLRIDRGLPPSGR